MARLPQLGSDAGTWGQILNDYLVQSHNADGTLKPGAVSTAAITDGTITEAKLDPSIVAKLNTPPTNTGVTSINTQTGAITLTKSDVGLSNVDNTADVVKSVLSASKLTIARTINGVAFDGSSDITVTDTTRAAASTTVVGTMSLTGGGALSTNQTLSLVNDTDTPGNGMYYGTNTTGVKGYFALPTPSVTPQATTTSSGTITLTGDLAGSAAAPSVAKINGISITGTPAVGQIIKATSATTASWQSDAVGVAATWGSITGSLSSQTDLNTALAGKVNLSAWTAKGDILAATGSGAIARTAVGTDGQLLAADSSQSNGVKWTTPAYVTGIGTTKITVSLTAPISPAVGDLWVDIS